MGITAHYIKACTTVQVYNYVPTVGVHVPRGGAAHETWYNYIGYNDLSCGLTYNTSSYRYHVELVTTALVT